MYDHEAYRSKNLGFMDILNYCLSPAPGVIQTKSGGLMACWHYRGVDTESCSAEEFNGLSARLNAILRKLGEGWMINVDALRQPSISYPERGAFQDRTTLVIDEERRQQFLSEGSHFETKYYLTLTYHPSKARSRKITDFLFDGMEKSEVKGVAARVVAQFIRFCADFEAALSSLLKSVRRIDRIEETDEYGQKVVYDEFLAFIEFCLSGVRRKVRLPGIPMYLDAVVGGYDVYGGLEPRIGGKWIKIVGMHGFPQESYPGILSDLDAMAVEYRWSTRFIPYEPYRGKGLLDSLRKKWAQRQRGLKDQLMETANGPVDLDAVAMTDDATIAMGEASSGLVRFGNYTSVVVLMHENKKYLEEIARDVMTVIENKGFGARVEDVNAFDAFIGSLPGHHRENVRRPMLHTMNLAHLLPITSVWPGEEFNPSDKFPKKSPALCYAATTGATPFRFNLHVNDVGHTMVIGRTGGGKSTLLNFLAAQWFRYDDARVFVFDKGMSSFTLCKAVGGEFYDIGGPEGSVGFCPLGWIKSNVDMAWGIDWICTLLQMQHVVVGANVRAEVENALRLTMEGAARERDLAVKPSLTAFEVNLSSQALKQAIRPYTSPSPLGEIYDSETDSLKEERFQVFELEHLMALKPDAYVPALLYLFKRIEDRLTGEPTLVIIDEAWLALANEMFREFISSSLRTWRKKNACVVLATQNMEELFKSPICDVLLSNMPTKVLLPNPNAKASNYSGMYRDLDMNDHEIDMLANAIPKRHYYAISDDGRRMFDFNFGRVALSFIGASGPKELKAVKECILKAGDTWPAEWLRQGGNEDWADYWLKPIR